MSIKKMMGVAIAAIAAGLALATVPANAQTITLSSGGTTSGTPGNTYSDNFSYTPLDGNLGVVTGNLTSAVWSGDVSNPYSGSGGLTFVYTLTQTADPYGGLDSIDTLYGYPGLSVTGAYSNTGALLGTPTGYLSPSALSLYVGPKGDGLSDGQSITFYVYTNDPYLTSDQTTLTDGGSSGLLKVWVPGTQQDSVPFTPAPEPASFAAFGVTGLLVLLLAARSRIRKPTVMTVCA